MSAPTAARTPAAPRRWRLRPVWRAQRGLVSEKTYRGYGAAERAAARMRAAGVPVRIDVAPAEAA